jgi:hypothetical protein
MPERRRYVPAPEILKDRLELRGALAVDARVPIMSNISH